MSTSTLSDEYYENGWYKALLARTSHGFLEKTTTASNSPQSLKPL